jgi:hypothetical protein
MNVSAWPRLRVLLLAALLFATLLAGPLTSRAALAKLSVCRTDPVIMLSNGRTVAMVATFTTDPSLLTHITYTVVAPAGVTILRVTYSVAPFTSKEKVVLSATNLLKTYTLSTMAQTNSSPFSLVAADTLSNTSTKATISTGSASGMSGATESIHLLG